MTTKFFGLKTHNLTNAPNPISPAFTTTILASLDNADALVNTAIRAITPSIAAAVDDVAPRLLKGGSIIYVGVGMAGRLAVLNAAECRETYNTERFTALVPRENDGLAKPDENDDRSWSVRVEDNLAALNLNPVLDTVVGIYVSGQSSYVMGALSHARRVGCLTIDITCTTPSSLSLGTINTPDATAAPLLHHHLAPVLGYTSRTMVGTAIRRVLNMLSTAAMISTGHTKSDLLSDVLGTESDEKLQQLRRQLVHAIIRSLPSFPTSHINLDDTIDKLLTSSDGSVELAVVAIYRRCSVEDARVLLSRAEGRLYQALGPLSENSVYGSPLTPISPSTAPTSNSTDHKAVVTDATPIPPVPRCTVGMDVPSNPPRLFLVVDGGGTRTRAIISTLSSCSCSCSSASSRPIVLSRAIAGPSSVSTLGSTLALSSIGLAVRRAVRALPPSYLPPSQTRHTSPNTSGGSTPSVAAFPPFEKIWLALAGIDATLRPVAAEAFGIEAAAFFGIPPDEREDKLFVSSDAALLGASAAKDGGSEFRSAASEADDSIALVAGTGSIAMRFSSSSPSDDTPAPASLSGMKLTVPFREVQRSGGLGYLLGDEGSGYDVGRQAVRGAMRTSTFGSRYDWTRVREAVLARFGIDDEEDLVSAIYAPPPSKSNTSSEKEPHTEDSSATEVEEEDVEHAETPKGRISGTAPLIIDLAFPEGGKKVGDEAALSIISGAVRALVELVREVMPPSILSLPTPDHEELQPTLLTPASSPPKGTLYGFNKSQSTTSSLSPDPVSSRQTVKICVTGGLILHSGVRKLFQESLEKDQQLGKIRIDVVGASDPGEDAALWLAGRTL